MLVLIQQDVGRLEVKVPDVDPMQLIQALQNIHSQGQQLFRAQWACVAAKDGQ